MNKKLLLNGSLVAGVLAFATGTYFTVHSTSSSAATTQTFANCGAGRRAG